MSQHAREFRLGDLLSLTLGFPTGNGVALVGHLTGPLIIPLDLWPCVHGQLIAELTRQHPWLAGIRFPAWLRPHDWAALWAWIDTLERKHGVFHLVVPLAALRLPDVDGDCAEGLGGDDPVG